ncbi:MAG: hypothetical protein IPL46_28915 [Saprospiraceae bacterium]|nr:hypothetical protein [Saprospiraceae bacterium]
MKTHLIIFILVLISFPITAQTNLYENPDFDRIARRHKIIGIIPFKTTVTLRPKQMKDITTEQLDRMEKSEGESIQHAMYSWFLKREKRGELTVKVQNPTTTNAKLLKAGLTADNFAEHTPDEIAKIMEVDAVIMGTFETDKPMSEGASLALGALFGFWGNTNKAVINLSIHNGADGELLINYNKGVSGSLGSSTEDLINTLMRKASRRISYSK